MEVYNKKEPARWRAHGQVLFSSRPIVVVFGVFIAPKVRKNFRLFGQLTSNANVPGELPHCRTAVDVDFEIVGRAVVIAFVGDQFLGHTHLLFRLWCSRCRRAPVADALFSDLGEDLAERFLRKEKHQHQHVLHGVCRCPVRLVAHPANQVGVAGRCQRFVFTTNQLSRGRHGCHESLFACPLEERADVVALAAFHLDLPGVRHDGRKVQCFHVISCVGCGNTFTLSKKYNTSKC